MLYSRFLENHRNKGSGFLNEKSSLMFCLQYVLYPGQSKSYCDSGTSELHMLVGIMADTRYGGQILADECTKDSCSCSVKNTYTVHADQYSIVNKISDCLQRFVSTHPRTSISCLKLSFFSYIWSCVWLLTKVLLAMLSVLGAALERSRRSNLTVVLILPKAMIAFLPLISITARRWSDLLIFTFSPTEIGATLGVAVVEETCRFLLVLFILLPFLFLFQFLHFPSHFSLLVPWKPMHQRSTEVS